MKKHTRIYLKFFDYGQQDLIESEMSGRRANDIHHIKARGMGGSKKMDTIKNLMALTRDEHTEYGDKKKYLNYLQCKHDQFVLQFLLSRPDKINEIDKENRRYYKEKLNQLKNGQM